MAEKTPMEKMRLKPGMRATLLHVPEDVLPVLGVSRQAAVSAEPIGADFILDFATTQAEAEERLRALEPHVGERTIAWIAYPKGSKAAGYDVNRDTIWQAAVGMGLVLVANIAVDQRWSAVRVRRA